MNTAFSSHINEVYKMSQRTTLFFAADSVRHVRG